MKLGEYIPSMQEELSRKTIETVEELFLRHRAGEISRHEFRLCVKTIFNIVAGLADRRVDIMLAQLGDDLKKLDVSSMRIELWTSKNDKCVILLTNKEREVIRVYRAVLPLGAPFVERESLDPFGERSKTKALEELQKLRDLLEKQGYARVEF
jgi:hypothetical protein